jgi:histidine decarboxylase
LRPLFYFPEPDYPRDERLPKQKPVPVYPVGPLLDAAIRLFGRIDKEATQVDRRRFPPMPGAHVICANKAASQRGPGYIWCAIAVAIAADRHKDANLFVEDANVIPVVETVDSSGRQIVVPSREQVEMILQQSLRAVAKSVLLCGQDQNVVFDKIYLGAKFIYARTDEWGCALTCAPYVVLAQDAVVPGKPAAHIMDLTITQWEQRLGLTPLPAVQPATESGSIGVEGWENDASHGGDP